MKNLFILFIILVLNYAISEQCEILFKPYNHNITLTDINPKYHPAFLYSLGRNIRPNKEETDNFNYGSMLYLGKDNTPYLAKNCIDSKLTATSQMDGKDLSLNISESHETRIINNPISEFEEWQTTCNKLSFKGVYTLTIQYSDKENPYDVELHVDDVFRKVFFYTTVKSNITYKSAYLILPDGIRKKINECTDYIEGTSKLFYPDNNLHAKILNIKKYSPITETTPSNVCTLMSLKGLYHVFRSGKKVGSIIINKDAQYQSTMDFSKDLFTLIYNQKNLPVYTSINNTRIKVSSCIIKHGSSFFINQEKIGTELINFNDAYAVYQDYDDEKNKPAIYKENLRKKYHLDQRITRQEVTNLLNDLHVPTDKQAPNQICKQLLYPGSYIINFATKQLKYLDNINLIEIINRYNKKINKVEINYDFLLKVYKGSDYEIDKYRCVDYFDENQIWKSFLFEYGTSTRYLEDSFNIRRDKFFIVKPNEISSIERIRNTPKEKWDEDDDIDKGLVDDFPNNSWLDNDTYKIKIRSERKCAKIEEHKSYSIKNLSYEAIIKIGKIDKLIFHNHIGYKVLLEIGNNGTPEDKSTIIKLKSHNDHKIISSNELSYCNSNENGSVFYNSSSRGLYQTTKIHSHNEDLRNAQLKFDHIEEIK